MKPFGEFDQKYSDKLMSACLKAMVDAAHDESTGVVILRNAEIYSALLTIMATLAATSDEAATPEGIDLICERVRQDLAERIASDRDDMQKHGRPFTVAEFKGYQ